MFNPIVYNARDTAMYDFSARTAFIRVELAPPVWGSAEDNLAEGSAQIRRHVDDVDSATIQYEDFSFVSKDGAREYDTRAECIIGEAIAASNTAINYTTSFRVKYKRDDREEHFTCNTHATFDEVVTYAFDNQYIELQRGNFSVQQLKVLDAVRQLRKQAGVK